MQEKYLHWCYNFIYFVTDKYLSIEKSPHYVFFAYVSDKYFWASFVTTYSLPDLCEALLLLRGVVGPLYFIWYDIHLTKSNPRAENKGFAFEFVTISWHTNSGSSSCKKFDTI